MNKDSVNGPFHFDVDPDLDPGKIDPDLKFQKCLLLFLLFSVQKRRLHFTGYDGFNNISSVDTKIVDL